MVPAEDSQATRCPVCGTELPPETGRRCPRCGARALWRPRASPVDIGMTLFNLKDPRSAEGAFARVISIDWRHLKANYMLSYIYYEWKEYARTIECLDRIREIADDKQFVNKYYGFCHYHLGNFDEAIRYLTVALESSPRYAKFRNYLRELTYENKLKEIGDLDARVREMETKLMNSKPTIRELSHLSMLYIFKGEYKKAEDLLLAARR